MKKKYFERLDKDKYGSSDNFSKTLGFLTPTDAPSIRGEQTDEEYIQELISTGRIYVE